MKCPICYKDTSRFKCHMIEHGFESLEHAYVATHGLSRPKCLCGSCDTETKLISWNKGFRNFVRGHNKTVKRVEQRSVCDENRKHIAGAGRRHTGHGTKAARIEALSVEDTRNLVSSCAPGFEFIEKSNDSTPKFTLRCKACRSLQEKSALELFNNVCSACDPAGSKSHIEIYRFARSIDPDTQVAADFIIPPDFVDIFMPGSMTAVEYNSLYFHSEIFKRRLYHAQKSADCNSVGVTLLHLFEDEWRDRKNACMSHIRMLTLEKQLLDDHDDIRCVLIDSKRKSHVFSQLCVEGDTDTCINIAVLSGDKEIAYAGFRRPRHRAHKGAIELVRFCNISGAGSSAVLRQIASYVFNTCESDSIVYAVDKRLGLDEICARAGFLHTRDLEPRYWWTDGHQRIARHKISGTAGTSLVKIWGCDVSLYELKKAAQ